MSQVEGVQQSQVPDDDDASDAYEAHTTPDSQDIESEREERTQVDEKKRQMQKMWDQHRDNLYAIVEQYLQEIMPNHTDIQETPHSIKVPSLYLQIRPSPIGIQIIWLDQFKEKKARHIFEAKELEEFLFERQEGDWYQRSLHAEGDRRGARQHAHNVEPQPDVRWRVIGFVLLLLSIGVAAFLLIMLLGM